VKTTPITTNMSSESKQNTQPRIRLNTIGPYNSVTITAPRTRERDVDLALVIDVSGSMDTVVQSVDEHGVKENNGLSRLDLVKHAARTIIENLGASDRLTIVKYTDNATVVLELTKMDLKGKKKAQGVVSGLGPEGMTNLWDGLYKGMQQLNGDADGRSRSIFLLTDGIPNVNPPMGYEREFRRYEEKCGRRCTVNMYGFGYSMQSDLLQNLAHWGDGIFGFIPDAGMIGTIFVNALANLRTTTFRDLVMGVTPERDVTVTVPGGYPVTSSGSSTLIKLGQLQCDQDRTCLFQLGGNPGTITLTLNYSDMKDTQTVTLESAGGEESYVVYETLGRVTSVDMLSEALQLYPRGQQAANELLNKQIQTLTSYASKSKYLQDLLRDLDGQVREAMSRSDWFTKWGVHYLLSLADAHRQQQCNNFKDPGVQHYGGARFNQHVERYSDVFKTIPAPKPSHRQQARRVVSSMGNYYNVGGGCFHGQSTVEMANGEQKRIDQLVGGDRIATPQGPTKVTCVVTLPTGGSIRLVNLDGCLITPWHPVYQEGRWVFPHDLGDEEEHKVDAVYNLVLDEHHIAVVNGQKAVTLGHNFQGPVVSHPYFGSDEVIKDLMKLNGWQTGRVDVQRVRRSETNQLVQSFA